MFSSISWSLFFIFITGALIVYYAVIGTLYFPKELLTFILGKANRVEPQPANVHPEPHRSVIGAVRDMEDSEVIDRFTASASGNVPLQVVPVPDLSLIESVSSLMEGIKTLFRVIKDADGNRTDVLSMFPSLLAQYPSIPESKYRFSINAFIHELCNAEFHYGISMDEVDSLWPVNQAA